MENEDSCQTGTDMDRFATVLSGLLVSQRVRPMTSPSPHQAQPEDTDNGQATYTGSVAHRKVSTKGSGGVSATVVVIAQQGKVRVSITPSFTWEAIMEPGKVDELIRTLTLAREDAKRMVSGKCLSRGDKPQAVGAVTVLPGNKAIGTKKVQS
ncbi:MAG: hypothetical protein ACRDTH_12080 [Pseudonocardiaceae bacterium]